MYSITEVYTGSPETQFVAVVYCGIQVCMLNHIKELACKTCNCTDSDKNMYKFNTVSTEFFTFLLQLNNEYVNNFLYTVIDDASLDNLFRLSETLTRLNNRCECFALSDSNDCGCG